MIQQTKEYQQNKRLIEENQKLELVVQCLNRQISNLTQFVDKSKKLQETVNKLNQELTNLKKDNFSLQETLSAFKLKHSQENVQSFEDQQQKIIENVKQHYEEELNNLKSENQKLHAIIQELNTKSTTSLQVSATKLVEIGNKIDKKLGEKSHRRILSNPTLQSPKGMSQEIYQNLIQQLTNQTEEKSILTSISKTKLQDSGLFTKSQPKIIPHLGINSNQFEQLLPNLVNVIKK
ncbi:unnamed protein product (macronuclear) [Paramecium tetraurelia]|uniref:Uncharacterized protein n=1 Tax=Paramecium tetraurelia TaxID=5888 RepID=A0D5F3_PARTE|nr:uncharacterized protein GSPATT00013719001 [Paramecium tetraurelia]CAK78270.1 unnamed protein product [Paramecium tetraurelia]|eukprot:XP_001445667.1 hypothetical protein (macronuclear) [Paramecium tetraurelia strain d4-2]